MNATTDLRKRVFKPDADEAAVAQIRELISREKLAARIRELAQEINAVYGQLDRPVVIGVIKGSVFFLSDLLRHLNFRDSLQLEFVRLASYGGDTESSGTVQAPNLDLPNLRGRHVLVVEDIIDSGRTAKFFLEYLRDQFNPQTLKMVCLLDKPSRRAVGGEADFVGFTIEDKFVIGFGLDYAEQFRELPFLGELVEFSAE
jgi:hypoxanthine phosphoribosyltransferase